MLLVPQIYLKNKKAVRLEGTTSALYADDPATMARNCKEAGADAILVIDVDVPTVGSSPNLPLIKRIHDELDLGIFVGGPFRSLPSFDPYIQAGVELIVLGSVAYQQPSLVEEAGRKLPGKLAVSLDVKGGRVTIPGWAATGNKTALDYAQRFREQGVRYIFYSDVDAQGAATDRHLESTLAFCRDAHVRVIITTEVDDLHGIERFARLGAPGLEALVLGKPLYLDRIDLRAANAFLSDLAIASENDTTLTVT